jgi:uncharacterized glyoxalase superfamily protein PhnB
MVSRIGNHIYAKGADRAIELYKAAFDLVEKGEPWKDSDGVIIHQDLWSKNGNLFLSVTEYKHLPNDSFIKKFSTDNCLTMLFFVFFSGESELRKTYEILSEHTRLFREIESEGTDLVCELIDKFGVFWHLRVPTDKDKVVSHFHTTL